MERGDLVVDVGAGEGVISRALADVGAEVIALELDPVRAARLRRRMPRPQVTVIETDAAAWAWPSRSFAVVANLPFARSRAILRSLLDDPHRPLRRVDAIVQWEMAVKHAAVWPATLRSVYWKAWFELSITGRLSRTSFAPVPSVDAAVLTFVRRDSPLVAPGDHARYHRFLRSGFDGARPVRSALQPSLSPLQLKRLAPALGFSPEARARDLDARQWAALFAFVCPRAPVPATRARR